MIQFNQKIRWTCFVTMAVVVVLIFLPPGMAKGLIEEGGPIELPTAIMLGTAMVICACQWLRTPNERGWLSGALVFLGLALRELDAHKKFTGRSVSSTGFYLSPEIPWQTKLVVVAAILPVAIATLHVMRIAWHDWRQHRPHGDHWFNYLVIGAAMLLISRVGEKTHYKTAYLIEEVCELSFAVCLIWLVLALVREEKVPVGVLLHASEAGSVSELRRDPSLRSG